MDDDRLFLETLRDLVIPQYGEEVTQGMLIEALDQADPFAAQMIYGLKTDIAFLMRSQEAFADLMKAARNTAMQGGYSVSPCIAGGATFCIDLVDGVTEEVERIVRDHGALVSYLAPSSEHLWKVTLESRSVDEAKRLVAALTDEDVDMATSYAEIWHRVA